MNEIYSIRAIRNNKSNFSIKIHSKQAYIYGFGIFKHRVNLET